jgi:hypothetical protein
VNKPRQLRDAAASDFFDVAPRLGSFLAMVVEEWWKLVGDLAHAFAGKYNHPADVIEEKRFGEQLQPIRSFFAPTQKRV